MRSFFLFILQRIVSVYPPPPVNSSTYSYHIVYIAPLHVEVMWGGATEATVQGFVYFVVINPCVLSANRVDFVS